MAMAGDPGAGGLVERLVGGLELKPERPEAVDQSRRIRARRAGPLIQVRDRVKLIHGGQTAGQMPGPQEIPLRCPAEEEAAQGIAASDIAGWGKSRLRS